ncbi:hypothetical protein B0H16DRAFT_1723428 [Mycena metata]|uniref:Uncharacterized protein n=1 Tax=Mycena metata TaxID=1033252 RepID=A0AAD7N9Z0_9AGAR|nr:hypothetical protein B0H16DRAFT_1723428 [Mycena metata]
MDSLALQEADTDFPDFDFVASSQPFEDGIDDWCSPSATSTLTPQSSTDPRAVSDTARAVCGEISNEMGRRETDEDVHTSTSYRRRRAHLIRRVPSSELCSPATPPLVIPRNFKLVRRVTMAADLERRRQRARDEAERIVKKIRTLASTTARLQRKHRKLREFVAVGSRANKENIFTV